ncbi:MAG TPA: type II toxin-antitoxin system PemK/MazF family toxin [archaeon]|nr:type II toxin-antitoxin system PemK/MazF family toxin [archaeon]
MNSSIIEQGELIVADILFAEQNAAKRRLALVISKTEYNEHSRDIIALKVTSQDHSDYFSIPLTNSDTAKKTLKKESFVVADFPTTISKQNVFARPDMVSGKKLAEIKAKIRELYEL